MRRARQLWAPDLIPQFWGTCPAGRRILSTQTFLMAGIWILSRQTFERVWGAMLKKVEAIFEIVDTEAQKMYTDDLYRHINFVFLSKITKTFVQKSCDSTAGRFRVTTGGHPFIASIQPENRISEVPVTSPLPSDKAFLRQPL